MPTWHVLRSDSVEQLLLVAVVADGVLGLEVRLEAERLVQLQGLDMETEIKESKVLMINVLCWSKMHCVCDKRVVVVD